MPNESRESNTQLTLTDGSVVRLSGSADVYANGIFLGATADPDWPSFLLEDILDADRIE